MEKRLKAYLLGDLQEIEREQLEEEYLMNKEILEQLEAVEDELIFAYARNELSAQDKAKIEKDFFLSLQSVSIDCEWLKLL